jgi:hypothetical protein
MFSLTGEKKRSIIIKNNIQEVAYEN